MKEQFKYDPGADANPKMEGPSTPEVTKKEVEDKMGALRESLPLDRPVWKKGATDQERKVFASGLRELVAFLVDHSGYLSDEERKDLLKRLPLVYGEMKFLNRLLAKNYSSGPKVDLEQEMKDFIGSSKLGDDLGAQKKERE